MKRKFYQSYDSGVIEFDPPVPGHPIVGAPIKQVVLSFGEYEDARVGYLVLQTPSDQFESTEAALTSLATDLFWWWIQQCGFDRDSQPCRCCRQDVPQTPDVFMDQFEDGFACWLVDLLSNTADQLGWIEDLDRYWDVFTNWLMITKVPVSQTAWVTEAAERVLYRFIDLEAEDYPEVPAWIKEGYALYAERWGDLPDERREVIKQSVRTT